MKIKSLLLYFLVMTLVACGGEQPTEDTDPEDLIPPSIAGAEPTAIEGSNLEFSLTLEYTPEQTVTGSYELISGTATSGTDFPAASGTFTIEPDQTSIVLSFPTTQDALDENDETLTLRAFDISGAGSVELTLSANLLDDDDPPTLSVYDTLGTEGNDLTFVASLSAPSAKNITFNYTSFDGSAVNPTDYTAASGSGGILAGSMVFPFQITTLDDGLSEGNESFSVQISALVNATAGDVTADGLIVDTGGTTPNLMIQSSSATEGDNMLFTLTLDDVPSSDVVVSYETIDGTASSSDYSATASGSFTVASGNSSAILQIPTTEDLLSESNESFQVSLTGATNAIVLISTATGTILDDDTPPDLHVYTAEVTEGETATVLVSLTSPAPSDVTFDISTSNGSAQSGSDYSSLSSLASTISAGSDFVILSVETLEDSLDETDEDFSVLAFNVSVANPVGTSGSITILDNDSTPSLSIYDADFNENTPNLGFKISLSEASGVSTAFDFQTIDNSAASGSDYTSLSRAFTIAAGNTELYVNIAMIDDSVFEGDEQFSASLSNLQWLDPDRVSAIGTILDNETQPDIFVSDAAVNEGETTEVLVNLSSGSASSVSFDYILLDGTGSAGTDFVADSGSVTMSAGALVATIPVVSTDDAVYEGDENFYVSLSNASNASFVDQIGQVSILENESPPVSYFAVTGVPTPQLEGTDSGAIITAYDINSNIKTDYVGTIAFSSDDVSSTLPGDFTFALANAGVVTISSGIQFHSPGTFFLRVDDAVASATGVQTGISVLNSDFSVTVNETGPQTDPALSLPIEYNVVFGAAIDPSTFSPGDIIQNGTASGITWSITNSGDDTNFTLSATAISGEGTVIPSIAASSVQTSDARQNLDSASTDNSVSYCALTSIGLTASNTTFPISTNMAIVATGVCANSSTVDISTLATWSSDNSSTVSVNSHGLASGVAGGTTTIRANAASIEGTLDLTVSTVTLTSLTIDPSPSSMGSSSNKQMTATAIFSDSSSLDVTGLATWSSNNGGVASVNGAGLVSSSTAGVVTISASYNSANADAVVTVNGATLDRVEITPLNNAAAAGSYVSYYLTAVYTDNSTEDVTELATWSSSEVATIDVDNSSQKGRAHYIAVGVATITGSYGGQSAETSATVNSNTLTSIQITSQKQSFPANFQQNFTATGTYSDSSTADLTDAVTWSSDAEAVASASNATGSKGLVSGLSAGTANISAQLGGVNSSLAVTITGATLSQLDVFPTEAFLGKDLNQQFSVTALFSDNTTLDVTESVAWSSSNSSSLNVSNALGSQGFATNLHSSTGTLTVTISAAKSGVSGESVVILSDATLTGINITPQSAVLNTSSGTDLKAYAKFSDGGSYEITQNALWSSADNSLGAASNALGSKGSLSTFAEGVVSVSGAYEGFSDSALITISNAGGEDEVEEGLGLAAYYYSGSNFDTFSGLRLDSMLDFDWGTGANGLGLSDNFSTRWLGRIKAPSTDDFTFYTNSDEGVRVYFDNQLIIDNYTSHTSTVDTSSSFSLVAGQEYNVIVEYYEGTGEAELGLQWSSGGISQQHIPQSNLLPPDASARPPGVENMALWLDSSDASTLFTDSACSTNVSSDGDGVGCWKDKSGYGRNFVQATANRKPAYRTSALNSLSGLDFRGISDGVGDVLEDDDGENYINGFSAFEFFVVIESDNDNTDAGVLDTEDPDGADDAITLRYDKAGWGGGCSKCIKGGIMRPGGTHVQSESATNTQSTSGQVIGATWQDGDSFKIYVDGVFSDSFNNGTLSGATGGASKVILGKGPKDTGGSSGWDGRILEVIYFNTKLTNAERDQVMSYLKSKWGI